MSEEGGSRNTMIGERRQGCTRGHVKKLLLRRRKKGVKEEICNPVKFVFSNWGLRTLSGPAAKTSGSQNRTK